MDGWDMYSTWDAKHVYVVVKMSEKQVEFGTVTQKVYCCLSIDWTQLAEDRVKRLAVVSTASYISSENETHPSDVLLRITEGGQ